jgi:hypothetical protein
MSLVPLVLVTTTLLGSGCRAVLGIGAPDILGAADGSADAMTQKDSTGQDVGGDRSVHETSADAEGVDAENATDATRRDTGAGPERSTIWNLAVVQSRLSTGVGSVSFPNPTTAGTLLIAIMPNGPPSGAGWTQLAVDGSSDGMYAWPNNPGGLETFMIDGGDEDLILVEFSGASRECHARHGGRHQDEGTQRQHADA